MGAFSDKDAADLLCFCLVFSSFMNKWSQFGARLCFWQFHSTFYLLFVKRMCWPPYSSMPETNVPFYRVFGMLIYMFWWSYFWEAVVVISCVCVCVYARMCMHGKSLQLCLTLWDPMDCSLPGSSVQGILQTKILEWVAVPSSKGSFWPRAWTCISYVPCIDRQILYHSAIWEAHVHVYTPYKSI